MVVRSRGTGAPRKVLIPPLSIFRPSPAGFFEITVRVLLGLMMLACLLVGVYVAAVLPYDFRAIIIFCLMISVSQVVGLVTWYQFPRSLWVFALTFHTVGGATWGLWLILFALYFPHRFGWDVRRPFLKWLLVVPTVVWSAMLSTASMASSYWTLECFM